MTPWAPLAPVFLSYVLSFAYLAIYWNNHHHMLHTCREVTGAILWANLHLLFWLSLFPFATGWMGENHFAAIPSALYFILQHTIIASQGRDSLLRKAIGNDWKGKVSPILYLMAIPLAFWHHGLAQGIYVLVALMWLVPDKRIEHVLSDSAT